MMLSYIKKWFQLKRPDVEKKQQKKWKTRWRPCTYIKKKTQKNHNAKKK